MKTLPQLSFKFNFKVKLNNNIIFYSVFKVYFADNSGLLLKWLYGCSHLIRVLSFGALSQFYDLVSQQLELNVHWSSCECNREVWAVVNSTGPSNLRTYKTLIFVAAMCSFTHVMKTRGRSLSLYMCWGYKGGSNTGLKMADRSKSKYPGDMQNIQKMGLLRVVKTPAKASHGVE